MLSHVLPNLDYTDLIALRIKDSPPLERKLDIAVLSDAATQQFAALMISVLARSGIHAQVYEAAFDSIAIEAYSPESGLYRFRPEVVIILND